MLVWFCRSAFTIARHGEHAMKLSVPTHVGVQRGQQQPPSPSQHTPLLCPGAQARPSSPALPKGNANPLLPPAVPKCRGTVVTACYPPGTPGELQTRFSADLTPNLKEALWRSETNALTQYAS